MNPMKQHYNNQLFNQNNRYNSIRFDKSEYRKYELNEQVSKDCWNEKQKQLVPEHLEKIGAKNFSNMRYQIATDEIPGEFLWDFDSMEIEKLDWQFNWLKHCIQLGVSTKQNCISREAFLKYATELFKLLRTKLMLPKLVCDEIIAHVMFEQYRGSICQLKKTDAPWNLNELCQNNDPPVRKLDGIPLYFECFEKIFPHEQLLLLYQDSHVRTTNCKGNIVWDQHTPAICTIGCQKNTNPSFDMPINYFEKFFFEHPETQIEYFPIGFFKQQILSTACTSGLILFSPTTTESGENFESFSHVSIILNGLEFIRKNEQQCRIFEDDLRWHAISFDAETLPRNFLSNSVFEEKCIDLLRCNLEVRFENKARKVVVYLKKKNILSFVSGYCGLFDV